MATVDLQRCEGARFASQQSIQWQFNLSRSPWWDGFFERMAGLVKDTLKKSLGHANLTFNELQEVLLVLNSVLTTGH